jgi:hypothetical protein
MDCKHRVNFRHTNEDAGGGTTEHEGCVGGNHRAINDQIIKPLYQPLQVDVHTEQVVLGVDFKINPSISIPKQFDVVTTIFCLEYSCETYEEYRRAVRGATKMIRPGGCLIYGGILEAKEYGFGGKRFKCHYLTRKELIEALKVCNVNLK